MRLTETERKVAELYAMGVRPRDIASRLGISINTVYKALSKARRVMPTIDDRETERPAGETWNTYAPIYTFNISVSLYTQSSWQIVTTPQVKNLDFDALIKKLDEILDLLKKEQKINKPIREQSDEVKNDGAKNNGYMPESLRRNVWISLLRSKSI
ncbi:MAG: sigma factor-like helix-turn-helix DNA-binding protein [Pyrobaculum sp.]